MKLVVTKKTLGTRYNLVIDDEGIHRHFNADGTLPEDAIFVPSSRYHEVRKLYGLKWRAFPPERFKRPYKALLEKKRLHLPWEKLIPQTIFQKELQAFAKGLQDDFRHLNMKYHQRAFEVQSPLFYALERAAIDVRLFNKFLLESKGTATGAVLKTFKPEIQTQGVWFASPIEYDRISSVTGRLKVRKGPGILHLKKKFRECLTSRWGADGAVYYLDFKSLEPRLLLTIREPDTKIPKDPYMYAAVSMGVEDEIDREHIKTAIISMIYGAGDGELARQLRPHIAYPEDFIKSVKERFGVEDLKERLRAEYEIHDGEMIYNHYGRPIFSEGTPPYVLVNYFIQSTAVDVALFGFAQIVDKLIQTGAIELIKPLFVLHDALILDVHNDVQHLLPKLAHVGSVGLPKFREAKFWIEVEQLSNSLDKS